MDRPAHAATAATIVVVGLLALASAMGVGRFAFTPLLPLMQAHDGLSLGQGAWLATANYLGYAAGALACSVRPPAPHAAARSRVGIQISRKRFRMMRSPQSRRRPARRTGVEKAPGGVSRAGARSRSHRWRWGTVRALPHG